MKHAHAAFWQGQDTLARVVLSVTSRHFVDLIGPGGVCCLRCPPAIWINGV